MLDGTYRIVRVTAGSLELFDQQTSGLARASRYKLRHIGEAQLQIHVFAFSLPAYDGTVNRRKRKCAARPDIFSAAKPIVQCC